MMLHLMRYGAVRCVNKALIAVFVICSAITARADSVEVIALGDSLTAGYGLMDADGFVPKMQAWLDDQGLDVRFVNAGVSGDTTAGGLSRVAWSLNPSTDAIVVALGGNDLLRGLDPSVSRANLEGILKVAQDNGLEILVVGMQAPGNYGPEYKAEFDAIYPDLAQKYDALYFPQFFQGLLSIGDTPAELREVMQPDGIHPNTKGVDLIVDAMGPTIAKLVARASD